MNCTIHYQIDFYCYHRQGHCKIYNKETTFIEFICRKSIGYWMQPTSRFRFCFLNSFQQISMGLRISYKLLISRYIVKLFLQNVVIFFLFRLNVIILDIFLFAQIFISEIQKMKTKYRPHSLALREITINPHVACVMF